MDRIDRWLAAVEERGDALTAAWKVCTDECGVMHRPVPEPPAATIRPALIRNISCSFRGAHQDKAEKIFHGPRVHICDSCIGDAGSLFMRYGWRPSIEPPDADLDKQSRDLRREVVFVSVIPEIERELERIWGPTIEALA